VADRDALSQTISDLRRDAEGATLLFYLRFFLHSIDESTQQILMATLSDAAMDGDLFAAEFRTDSDESARKVYGGHFRRFQSGAVFGRALSEQFGFEILDAVEGTGLSPYLDEDPHLYRVVARRRRT
jgi:hypothetical protein